MKQVAGPVLGLVAVAAISLATVTPSVGAQTFSSVDRRIVELEKQVEQLRLLVTRPGTSALRGGVATEAVGAADAAPGGDNLMAQMTLRLQELESALADLRGQVEEVQFEVRRHRQRSQSFREDVEFRLSQLEGGSTGRAPGADDAAGDAARDGGPTGSPGGEALAPPPAGDASAGEAMGTDDGPLPEGNAQTQYDYAYGLLRRGNYGAAERAFRAFVERHGSSDLAGNAQYWLGETHYARQQYPQAAQAFLKGFQDYQRGAKGPDSLLKLGLSLANLGNTDRACDTLNELDRAYPDAPARITRRAAQERARLGC
ncbi:tol-pal system protein YbgF [Rhodothalassium salexigens]|uniref:tol-pal system protein YbgF n=1 Tax=Rhodothalassium salexigens TaxID=1086 RepID=UPI0019147F2E|nr:tol-pal system protein YbgF [Rhodothalassium salexigens]MBK5910516.1 tol-pal system protein YbgF [Rhodothalassium salexigens]MBK5919845.1 tol-pal system protein YbgF [Rhodothalassium salexigens]